MKRNPYLRVKLKSLAAEAKIIRQQEVEANQLKDYGQQNSLREHRTGIVRRQSRATLLAYQFLRGVPYAAVERPNSKPVDWKPVLQMVKKYGDATLTAENLYDWRDGKKLAIAA